MPGYEARQQALSLIVCIYSTSSIYFCMWVQEVLAYEAGLIFSSWPNCVHLFIVFFFVFLFFFAALLWCRIDAQYVLKVADFGLSEAKCNKDYVRQQMTSEVKLPIKWMAPESINDGIFSEKTDVVCDIIAVAVMIIHCKVI